MRKTSKQNENMKNFMEAHIFWLQEFGFSTVDNPANGIKNSTENEQK